MFGVVTSKLFVRMNLIHCIARHSPATKATNKSLRVVRRKTMPYRIGQTKHRGHIELFRSQALAEAQIGQDPIHLRLV